jgi:hypothetical protein
MRVLLGAAGVVAAVFLIYGRSTTGYFFDDDFHWLAQTLSLSPNFFDLSRYDHFYRPVIELYFLAGLTLFGCDPFPFHLLSIAIHLLTTSLLFFFARDVSQSLAFAALTGVFFAVQPGFTDAVTWIAAITDLMPVLWYVLTVWLHLRFLQTGRGHWYVGALLAFLLCHLTHESAATLLPMMAVVELTFAASGTARQRLMGAAGHWRRYLPFAIILAGFLAVAYEVNTRSYLVREGHYALGWHAATNILNYIIWLYVGQRALVDYVATMAVVAAVLVWGTPRMRFSVIWIVLTLLPVSFFTWGNAARYLYLPAPGFAMLVADLMLALNRWTRARVPSPNAARVLTGVIVAVMAARFAVFAKKAADSFPARTTAYERFVTQLRGANQSAGPGASVVIESRFLEGVPELYREPAAAVGLCLPNLRLEIR